MELDSSLPNTTHTRTAQTKQNEWDGILKSVRHWLPSQGPIKDFVHHNTLHSFQNLPFSEAIRHAGSVYGAYSLLPLETYRSLFREGRIRREAIGDQDDDTLKELFEYPETEYARPKGVAESGLRSQLFQKLPLSLSTLSQKVRPLLFRLVSAYLDQGISIWRIPHAQDSFYQTVQRITRESWLPIAPLSDEFCRSLLNLSPDEAIDECLRRLLNNRAFHERYVLEMLLSHPGWSGMISQVEENPGSLLSPRKITLKDTVAIELILECGWIARALGSSFTPLVKADTAHPRAIHLESVAPSRLDMLRQIWHDAFEQTLYEDAFHVIRENVRSPLPAQKAPKVQTVFCIDDREVALRRHIEETSDDFETYSAPGFFGIDFLYQGIDDTYPAQQCPVVLKPKHLVRAFPSSNETLTPPKLRQLFHFDPSSHTLFRGFLISQVLGVWSAIRLAIKLLRPHMDTATSSSLSKVETHSQLHLLRENDEPTPEGYLLGYTFDEMADRVGGFLRNIGLTKSFAPVILIVAHGSSSSNNPHFAAYDCGACSGKPGAPNARAFVWMANHPEVRARLKTRGIDIPETSSFLAGLHDTTRDEILYFPQESGRKVSSQTLTEIEMQLRKALEKNAAERCRRFEVSASDPHKEVQRRSTAIFEPRPELNHATNALLIVGRRALTRGTFLDRRAFMNSYDPTTDPEGNILFGILSAAIPVCAGINLEYFFSRIDNEVYGAGTKLPHNVMGLIGVANGIEGDLRTGLPSQMIELHDPIRLLVIVEHQLEVALGAVKRNAALFEWIDNNWITYACYDGSQKEFFTLKKGQWQAVNLLADPPKVSSDSLAVLNGSSGNLPFQLIRSKM